VSLAAALALLGGAVLLALALHGWWRVRRAEPRSLRQAAPGFAASTLQPRAEPTLDGEPEADTATDAESTTLPQDTEPPWPEGASGRTWQPRRPPRLDALIDALVPLALEAPVSAEAVLAQVPASRRAGNKPWHIEGLDVLSGEWSPLLPGQRYGELQAGVQMASRQGPINEIEYSEFVQHVQALAQALGAHADVPDMLEVVARGRELDTLVAPLDAQLTITLRSRGVAWSVGFVQQVAQRAGLRAAHVAGRWVLAGDEPGAPPLLVLALYAQAALATVGGEAQSAAVREALLTLDVPQTPVQAEPFALWHRLCLQLCEELDATACDDQGQPISPEAFAAIGREIEALYARLEQLGLPAGSAVARRLFA